jgi:hypothetical protein
MPWAQVAGACSSLCCSSRHPSLLLLQQLLLLLLLLLQMLSVANARCDGSIEFTSQKNKQVSISAPGMAILSSVPRHYGTMRGHISTSPQVTTGATLRMAGYLANGFLVSDAITHHWASDESALGQG